MAKYTADNGMVFNSKSDLQEYEYLRSLEIFRDAVKKTFYKLEFNVRDIDNSDISRLKKYLDIVLIKRYNFNHEPFISEGDIDTEIENQLNKKEQNIVDLEELVATLQTKLQTVQQELKAIKQKSTETLKEITRLSKENTALKKQAQNKKLSPKIVKELTVNGSSTWINTNIDIPQNCIVSIKATGSVLYDNDNHWVGPEGEKWSTKEDPLPKSPHASLVGRLDRKVQFYIGRNFTTKKMPEGILYLGINDKWCSGNKGSFTVTITIEPIINGETHE